MDGSEPCWRRAPRIISRSRLRPTTVNTINNGDNNSATKGESNTVKEDNEMDDEVGEGFVVRGGVMMRIADLNKEQWKPVKRFYIDVNRSQIYQDARVPYDGSSSDDEPHSSRVTVEVSALPGDGRMFHVSDNLPGVANEVESYPCRYCPNRIFLTSFGLERHTETEHKDHLPEVMEDILRIQNEWRRREAFKAIAKKRREALKKTRMLTEVVRRSQGLPSEAVGRFFERHYKGTTNCHICGLRFEANSEVLMSHVRAHRKNDDLRRRLLANFGSAYVARCTCRQCHLVFINEKNLMLHNESSHVRKRKYVCKWCGDVCLSVNELNEHKKDVHGVSYGRPEKLTVDDAVSISSKCTMKSDIIANNNCLMQRKLTSGNVDESASAKNFNSMFNQNPCMTKCSECDLATMKPSLLIRHMQRVHNKSCFSAVIEIKGMPDMRVDMDRGKVTWWCCDIPFEDRHRFIHHRKSCHQPFLQGSSYLQNWPLETEGQIVSVEEAGDDPVIGEGQIVQLVNPDGTQSDELYVLVAEDKDPVQSDESILREVRTCEPFAESAQQITLTTEEYMQLRQQLGGNFSAGMQLVLVDDVNNEQHPSPDDVMESSVDFIANNVVDNDILNSSLISGAQIPSTDKYYSDTQATDPEFSVANVPDNMEDDSTQSALTLSSGSLMDAGTNSSGLPMSTFNRSNLMGNSPDRHFQVQRNVHDELTTSSAITIPNNAQQLYGDISCSSANTCTELDSIKISPAPETSSPLIAMNSKIGIPSPSNTDYCIVENPKADGFLEKPGNRTTSVIDGIPTLLDLEGKSALTATTTAAAVGSSSLSEYPSTDAVGHHIVSFYGNQDIGSTAIDSPDKTIYNL